MFVPLVRAAGVLIVNPAVPRLTPPELSRRPVPLVAMGEPHLVLAGARGHPDRTVLALLVLTGQPQTAVMVGKVIMQLVGLAELEVQLLLRQ